MGNHLLCHKPFRSRTRTTCGRQARSLSERRLHSIHTREGAKITPLPEGPATKTQKSLRKLQLSLVLALLILVATVLRIVPLLQYSPSPSGYEGPAAFRQNYILQTGHSWLGTEPAFSAYSSGVLGGRGEILLDQLLAIESIVLGSTSTISLVMSSIVLGTTLLFLVLIIARRFRPTPHGTLSLTSMGAIGLFTLLGTAAAVLYLTGWNTAYGWLLIGFCIYSMLRRRDVRFAGLLMTFSLAIVMTYATAALVYGIFLTTLFVVSAVLRRWETNPSYIFTFWILYLAYVSYISVLVFGTLLHIPTLLSNIVTGESKFNQLSYLAQSSTGSKILHGISAATGLAPLAYFVFRRPVLIENRPGYLVLIAFAFSLVPLTFGFYSSLGVSGVFQRGAEYGGLVSIIIFPILVMVLKGKGIREVTLLVLIAVLLSVVGYYTSETLPGQYLTQQEASGADWLIQHSDKTNVTFTDLQLSAPFVAAGYFRVLGIPDTTLDPSQVNAELQAIYYGTNPELALGVLAGIRTYVTDQRPDYLYFSSRMSQNFPGITGYNYVFAPAPNGFMSKFDASPQLGLIYNNGQAFVYWNS